MLTFEEMLARTSSVSKMHLTLLRAENALWDRANKLKAFNTLLEPPVQIRTVNDMLIKQLYAEMHEAHELRDKLEKIEDKLYAMPYIGKLSPSINGEERTYVGAGMLPDFSPTSENEDEALKMLADYYARETA